MTTQHYLQLAGGALLVIFGIASLFTGWVAQNVAVSFIVTGLSTFGITLQVASLGNKLAGKE